MEEYLASLTAERGLSRNSVAAYRRDLAAYLAFLDDRLADPHLVESYLQSLTDAGMATRTVVRKLAAIRGLHRFMVVEGTAAADPTVNVESPKRPDPAPKALSIDETIRLVEAPDISTPAGRRDRAILEFLYASGCRVSEAVQLDLAHLDLEDGIAVVTGKGSKQRLVPVGSAAVRAIREWLEDRLDLVAPGNDAVFINLRGRRLSRQAVFDLVKRWSGACGIRSGEVSPHILRHSAATHMLEGGADLRTVQEILGHASLSTTQVYTRVTASHLWEVYATSHPRSR